MHFTGEVYRHPMEARTPLLEVTSGCSHNKCSFCTMYRKTPFSVSPVTHIEEDLKELNAESENISRIYLVNADPFVLSTEKLVEIGTLIQQYLPKVETITGYASMKNIKKKSLEEWKKLRDLGYNDLHIGIESAFDPALSMMNKGFTNKDAYEQLDKLEKANIRYDALLMLGVAGRNHGKSNTEATVQLLSRFKPYMISIMPTSVTPGSELEEICDRGDYVELTELEMLQEEIRFLQALDVEDDCFFFGSHNFNLVPVSGEMRDKNRMISILEQAIATYPDNILNQTKPRGPI